MAPLRQFYRQGPVVMPPPLSKSARKHDDAEPCPNCSCFIATHQPQQFNGSWCNHSAKWPPCYRTQEVPPFQLPTITGTWLKAAWPDTLDLAEIAERSVHGMLSILDPQVDFELYGMLDAWRHPPVLC